MPKIAWIIDGLFTRFDKHGSMIHKIHAFVPSVIGMRKVEGIIRSRKRSTYTEMISHSQKCLPIILKVGKTMESCTEER